jgi:drug/metabolite transporter (DMT)-like permease
MESSIVVGSEVALALYPLLIKLVDTNLQTQLLARFLTFGGLAALLAKPSALTRTWGSVKGASKSLALGTLTLSHVAASYYAFETLPAGPAMALFYTYPILNLIAGALFFGETVSILTILLCAVAAAGVLLVAYGTESPENEKEIRWDGVASALAAAATETAMYFAVKTATHADAYASILELYPGALVGLGLWLLISKQPVDFRGSSWGPMLLFNTLIGFIGYALRYYAIPKVSTAVFSLLSFVGVSASFLFGWLFAEEVPTWKSTVGATLISIVAATAKTQA